MKQNALITGSPQKRKVATCLECSLCKAINYEESRPVASKKSDGIKALYDAEAAAYYFYSSYLNLAKEGWIKK